MAPADRVSVIGESIIDIIDTGRSQQEHVGGSPLNVACGLAALGVSVDLMTRIGMDAHGDLIRDHLGGRVTINPRSFQDAPTSTARARLRADGAADYTFEIDWAIGSLEELPVSPWTHVGSIATFLAPGADEVERRLERIAGVSEISYDPNIRPQLLRDRSAAIARFERLSALASVVKLSDEDAAWLYPDRGVAQTISRILDKGPRLAVVTRGARGAILATRATVVEVEAFPVVTTDTVGAGDSFTSALIFSILTDGFPVDAASLLAVGRFSAAAAAVTCSRAGAHPPSRHEVSRLAGL